MKIGLLIVDVQNDYFPNGKMELSKPIEALQNVEHLLNFFRMNEYPIFHVQHISINENATFFLPNTTGVEIHPDLKPRENESLIQKHFPNSFRDTNLLNLLQKEDIDTVVICGMMTHMCIDSTTRAAFDYGFNCIVIEDACTTKDLQFNHTLIPAEQVHQSFISALNGIFAKINTADDFIQSIKR